MMKAKRFIVLTALVLSLIFTYSCFAEDRICSVDLMRVLDEYKKRKDFDAELETKMKSMESERNKLIENLKEIQDKITLLSDKEKEKKQKELTTKSRQLQEFDQKMRVDLRKLRDERLREIDRDVRKVAEEFAKKEKCGFIVVDSLFLYGQKDSDVTAGFIKTLNKKYKK